MTDALGHRIASDLFAAWCADAQLGWHLWAAACDFAPKSGASREKPMVELTALFINHWLMAPTIDFRVLDRVRVGTTCRAEILAAIRRLDGSGPPRWHSRDEVIAEVRRMTTRYPTGTIRRILLYELECESVVMAELRCPACLLVRVRCLTSPFARVCLKDVHHHEAHLVAVEAVEPREVGTCALSDRAGQRPEDQHDGSATSIELFAGEVTARCGRQVKGRKSITRPRVVGWDAQVGEHVPQPRMLDAVSSTRTRVLGGERQAIPSVTQQVDRYRQKLTDAIRATLARASRLGEIPEPTVAARMRLVRAGLFGALVIAHVDPSTEVVDALEAVRHDAESWRDDEASVR